MKRMLARASIAALVIAGLSGCAISASNCLAQCQQVMNNCAADNVQNCDIVVQTCMATVCSKYW